MPSRTLTDCTSTDCVHLDPQHSSGPLLKSIAKHLVDYSNEGLRTLMMAKKNISEGAAKTWLKKFEAAAVSMNDRKKKLSACAEEIEKDMTIVGASAIEDRLQAGVPDTIATLAEAGIKLWVLTGDKLETAINIGYSAKLLRSDMDIVKCDVKRAKQIADEVSVGGARGMGWGGDRRAEWKRASVLCRAILESGYMSCRLPVCCAVFLPSHS